VMNTYKRHRFPPDIISYAVWLYHRFNLSNRDVEDLLAERASLLATKPSDFGVSNLVLDMLVVSNGDTVVMAIRSSSTRSS